MIDHGAKKMKPSTFEWRLQSGAEASLERRVGVRWAWEFSKALALRFSTKVL